MNRAIVSATEGFQYDRFLPFPADRVATADSVSKVGNNSITPIAAASKNVNRISYSKKLEYFTIFSCDFCNLNIIAN